MADPAETRVAVYIDFDNIVISRYDQVHGRDAWRKDNARDGRLADKLARARVDIGAVLDYASSWGAVALSRAYADWSVPANAAYRGQLVDRAIDLTQLFPATGTKNGADIRLAVDVVDDLFRLPELTHVVIVAGDSDYIALAQRCRRLGRTVVGIGITGSTSPALVKACDEFEYYDAIPGRDEEEEIAEAEPAAAEPEARTAEASPELTDRSATRLLMRALDLGTAKTDSEWVNASALKQQMKRLNSAFSEKALGFDSFTDFVRSRNSVVESREAGQSQQVRLRKARAKK